jgi:acyl-CoA oxidase
MISDIAARLRPRQGVARRGGGLFNANQAELIEAARAHGELLQWEAFSDGIAKVEDAGTAQVLTWLRDLFGMHLIEKHLAWYLINGRLSAQRAASVSRYIDRLALRLRPHAQDLVDALASPPSTCAHPSPRAPSRRARTRRARTTPTSPPPATRPSRRSRAPRRSSTGAHVGARTQSVTNSASDAAIGCGVRGILRSS